MRPPAQVYLSGVLLLLTGAAIAAAVPACRRGSPAPEGGGPAAPPGERAAVAPSPDGAAGRPSVPSGPVTVLDRGAGEVRLLNPVQDAIYFVRTAGSVQVVSRSA